MTAGWSSSAILDAARRGELGTVVKLARKAHGLTQAELGAACGYSQSVVSRIERGQRHAFDIRFLHRIADVLEVPPELLGLAGTAAEQPSRLPPVDRRDRDLSTGTGTDAGTDEPAAPVLLPPLPRVADPTADALRVVTAAHRRLDAWLPSRELVEPVMSHLRLAGRAARTAPDAKTRADLAGALSEIAGLAGWLHLDMFDLGSAYRHADLAVRSARASGDRLLIAYMTGGLAALSTRPRDGSESLGLVAVARQQLGADRPAIVDAWLGAVAAFGHSVSGDERATLAALDHALAAAERVPTEEPPPWPWVFTIDTATVAAYRLACTVRLHRPTLALRAAEEARPTLARRTKQTALWRLDHAAAHLQAGEVDEAFSLATQVLVTTKHQQSARIVERARALRRSYGTAGKGSPSQVLAFDEHLRAVGV